MTDLYAKIGQLTMERVLCRGGPVDEQAGTDAMLDRDHPDLSVRRQCALLSLARSGVYRPRACCS